MSDVKHVIETGPRWTKVGRRWQPRVARSPRRPGEVVHAYATRAANWLVPLLTQKRGLPLSFSSSFFELDPL